MADVKAATSLTTAFDFRPYLNTNPDIGAENLDMSEIHLANMLRAMEEFFDPSRAAKTYFTVGKERYRVSGNYIVMTAHSSYIASKSWDTYIPKPEEPWIKHVLGWDSSVVLEDLSISASPRAFASAWLFINGITPNPHAPWVWGFEGRDHVMLFHWLVGLDALDKIYLMDEWFSGMVNSFGEYKEVGSNIFSAEAGYSRYVTKKKLVPKVSPETLALLDPVYNYLQPICQRVMQGNTIPPILESIKCSVLDDILDLKSVDAPRFRDWEEQMRRSTKSRLAPMPLYTEKKGQITKGRGRFLNTHIGPNTVPDLELVSDDYFSDDAGAQTLERYAASLLFAPERSNLGGPTFAYPLKVGKESVTIYGDPLVMSVYSEFMATTYSVGKDVADYPVIASHLSVGQDPYAFVAVWLYVNGITSSYRDTGTLNRNLTIISRLHMWDWIDYLGVDTQDQFVQFWFRDIVDDLAANRAAGRELGEDEKKYLSIMHSKVKSGCERKDKTRYNLFCRKMTDLEQLLSAYAKSSTPPRPSSPFGRSPVRSQSPTKSLSAGSSFVGTAGAVSPVRQSPPSGFAAGASVAQPSPTSTTYTVPMQQTYSPPPSYSPTGMPAGFQPTSQYQPLAPATLSQTGSPSGVQPAGPYTIEALRGQPRIVYSASYPTDVVV